jgi:stearoyl-CoA desaturase (delta-9 desaturase)
VEERQTQEEMVQLKDATRSFFGGMNNHSGAAREMMRCLRIAKLAPGPGSDADNGAGIQK